MTTDDTILKNMKDRDDPNLDHERMVTDDSNILKAMKKKKLKKETNQTDTSIQEKNDENIEAANDNKKQTDNELKNIGKKEDEKNDNVVENIIEKSDYELFKRRRLLRVTRHKNVKKTINEKDQKKMCEYRLQSTDEKVNWSHLTSPDETLKVQTARAALKNPRVRPAWIFESLGTKNWGTSKEIVETWLMIVKQLPRKYPLGKNGGLRLIIDAVHSKDYDTCTILAECLKTLSERDDVILEQILKIIKAPEKVMDHLLIAAVQCLITALSKSKAKKTFTTLIECLPFIWHLESKHLLKLFDVLFTEPEGFKQVEGLKKLKLEKGSSIKMTGSYHTQFFTFISENRNIVELQQLIPVMLKTFFKQWKNRKTAQFSETTEGTIGTKRAREELKAKFDPGVFFFGLLSSALLDSENSEEVVPTEEIFVCVNACWLVCLECSIFRKDTDKKLLDEYVTLLSQAPNSESKWEGFRIALTLDSTCMESHLSNLWRSIKKSPPVFTRTLLHAYSRLNDVSGLLESLATSPKAEKCICPNFEESLQHSFTVCLPGQVHELFQQLNKIAWAAPLLAAVLEGAFVVTEQTAQEIEGVVRTIKPRVPRLKLAKQAALRRLAAWTGSDPEEAHFECNEEEEDENIKLTIQLHRLCTGEEVDLAIFQELPWSLVQPHLLVCATQKSLHPYIIENMEPEDIALALETCMGNDEDFIAYLAKVARKKFACAKVVPVTSLPSVEVIRERSKWSPLERIEILERLPNTAEKTQALRSLGVAPISSSSSSTSPVSTREEILRKHKLDSTSFRSIFVGAHRSKKITPEELTIVWQRVKDHLFTFHDMELLHKLLIKTRPYSRLWQEATKNCITLATWSKEPATILLQLFKLSTTTFKEGPPAWVKLVPAILSCIRQITESVYQATSGVEAIRRARQTIRIWQALATGSTRFDPSVGQKKLQKALRKYIIHIVALFLDLDRSFIGSEQSAKRSLAMINKMEQQQKENEKSLQVTSFSWDRTEENQSGSLSESMKEGNRVERRQTGDLPKKNNGVDEESKNEKKTFDTGGALTFTEEVARWKEAQQILQSGLLPLVEQMEERQKQALFTQLQEPMKTMFKEIHTGFKKHGFYTGRY